MSSFIQVIQSALVQLTLFFKVKYLNQEPVIYFITV